MPAENKSVTPRQIGLKDVHVALITSDGSSGTVYEKPICLGVTDLFSAGILFNLLYIF